MGQRVPAEDAHAEANACEPRRAARPESGREGWRTRKIGEGVGAETENGRWDRRQKRTHAPNRHQSEESPPPIRKMKQNRRHLEPIREQAQAE